MRSATAHQDAYVRSLGLLLSIAAATACSEAPAPSNGRGVLLVVMDAWRYDRLDDREITLNLTGHADRWVSFSNAWSTAPQKIPAHASILTGCDPLLAQRPRIGGWHLPAALPRLPLEFMADGWTTAAFADHPYISGLPGFEVGFRDFVPVGGEDLRRPERGWSGVGKRFAQWARELAPDEDWFAYVHMNDLERLWQTGPEELKRRIKPHPEREFVPARGDSAKIFYAVPPSRWREGFTLADYEVWCDTQLAWVDLQLERIFVEVLEPGGWSDRTTVVLVGSYGIDFGEAGRLVASGTLSDVDLHVPLLIRPAPQLGIATGRTIDPTVSLVDVAPTLIDLYGLPIPAGMGGVSLVPLLRGERSSVRSYAHASHAIYPGWAVFDERHSYRFAQMDRLESWTGKPPPSPGAPRSPPREVLEDRSRDPDPARRGTVANREVADAMRAARDEKWRRNVLLQKLLHHSELGLTIELAAKELELLHELEDELGWFELPEYRKVPDTP